MSLLFTNSVFYFPSATTPIQRGAVRLSTIDSRWQQRLPTDAIGTTAVTFAGVHADSEIRVYDASQTEIAGVESCIANQQLTWPAYALNSVANNVIIRIVHTNYLIIVIPYTTIIGAQSVPVQQSPDKWFRNPT